MRLIDADDLTRKIEKSYFTSNEKRLFIVKVRHMPTIETLQGEWIEDYTESCHSFLGCHCSLCNADALEKNEYPYYSKFCPNCGAYMKGGLNNG